MTTVEFVSAKDIAETLSPAGAVAALEDALRAGFDPAADFRRGILDVAAGQLLVMPAQSPSGCGVKIASVAPGNPERGLPRIQAVYVLFDGETLTPRALLDGTALTTLRTPAVSITAVKPILLQRTEPLHVTVFGAGPQGAGHVATIADVLRRPFASVTHVVRSPEAVTEELHPQARVVAAGSAAAEDAVRRAHVVVCATGSAEPVFDSAMTRPGVVVLAVGSHEPDRREVDAAFLGRAQVVVEDRATAVRESGDVVLAIAEGALSEDDLIPMADVVTGRTQLSGPVLFKSSGMSWEDVVVAQAVADRLQPPSERQP
ncbi:ornithine cyclodeaminase family protein [Amycolatopsis benzoatilytica]|uniref:ornithine cyclodeaminase family protein n=1 Tax=Amycolatopsis benzoatilytica TaxID=346045 RepID=UPI00037B4115|nr:ornithine cyclodeaminase family protein [Amycolatopsis benzoatilytica]